jgi:hypothetical protein
MMPTILESYVMSIYSNYCKVWFGCEEAILPFLAFKILAFRNKPFISEKKRLPLGLTIPFTYFVFEKMVKPWYCTGK